PRDAERAGAGDQRVDLRLGARARLDPEDPRRGLQPLHGSRRESRREQAGDESEEPAPHRLGRAGRVGADARTRRVPDQPPGPALPELARHRSDPQGPDPARSGSQELEVAPLARTARAFPPTDTLKG